MARELVLIPRSEYEKLLSYREKGSEGQIMEKKSDNLTAERNRMTKEDLVDNAESNKQHQQNTLEKKDGVDITDSNNLQQQSVADQKLHLPLISHESRISSSFEKPKKRKSVDRVSSSISSLEQPKKRKRVPTKQLGGKVKTQKFVRQTFLEFFKEKVPAKKWIPYKM